MKVTVFGSGYVGLVTAACLAETGNDVLCMDVDKEKIDKLKQGIIPIFEPGLDELVLNNTNAGRLTFTTDAQKAVEHGLFQFIAVGTPPDEDGSADLQYVLSVADTIATHISEYKVVINKSTVPVGTADKVRNKMNQVLAKHNKNTEFDVVSNPEFLKEGAAISDFMKPDRIIVGVENDEVEKLLRNLYAPFNRNHERVIAMDVRSAELTKYASNAMLATKISFMNELANLAELLNADIEQVRIGMGADQRIGYSFIYPGCGYGGSCFPKDVKALEKTASDVKFNAELLQAVENVNIRQKQVLSGKILQHYEDNIKGKKFAVWGLAFKPNTDDMREAPSRVLIEELWRNGAITQVYDPEAMDECKRIYGNSDNLIYCDSPIAATQGADALVVVTEWQTFRSPDFDLLKNSLADAVIFDGRNIYDPQQMNKSGITYYSIGRNSKNQ